MNYQKIYSFDLANGPGVRASLFVSGCNIHCSGCFNQEAWSFKSGKPFTRKTFKALKKIFKDERYDGFSILGGEPFDQKNKDLKILIKLCKSAHKYNKNIWIWTGHEQEELTSKLQLKLLQNCDVIITGKFIKEYKSFNTPFRGSSNQKIINLT